MVFSGDVGGMCALEDAGCYKSYEDEVTSSS